MSVAAMTMDDQRPLMNSAYDKMTTKYEQTMHAAAANVGAGAAAGGNGGATTTTIITSSSVSTTTAIMAAPPSGPASPTPSGPEEPHHHHQHNHHHHHHPHHHHTTPPQLQQQQQAHHHDTSASSASATPQQQLAVAAAAAEQRQRLLEDEIEHLKVEQSRLSQQCADAQRREKILMRRLANKEQEFQDYVSQIAEYKAAQAPSAVALRSALLDPAVNLLFEKLKKELKATKAKLEETQNELSAWKFTPDSNTGKRLMAKCRLLYQENEELGKMTSNGRLAKLETELAMQKSLCEAVRKSQSECDDLVQELDEDIEGMESTILYLQQELQALQDRYEALEKENMQLKNGLLASEKDRPALMGAPEEMHSKLNGTPMITSGAGEIYQQQINADAPHTNASSSYTTATTHSSVIGGHLETIDENECIHSTTTTTTTVQHDYYNGSGAAMAAEEQQQQSMADDATDLNCLPSKFRSMASRKRTYEAAAVDSSELAAPVMAPSLGVINTATMQPMVNVVPMYATQSIVPPPVSVSVHVPRTLPPKKSKLRGVTPVRRNSAQSDDIMVENNGGTNVYNAAPMTPTEQIMPPQCSDNNAAPTTVLMNDEETEETVTVDSGSGGVVAQRIMTRRRSVRQCAKAADPTAIIE